MIGLLGMRSFHLIKKQMAVHFVWELDPQNGCLAFKRLDN